MIKLITSENIEILSKRAGSIYQRLLKSAQLGEEPTLAEFTEVLTDDSTVCAFISANISKAREYMGEGEFEVMDMENRFMGLQYDVAKLNFEVVPVVGFYRPDGKAGLEESLFVMRPLDITPEKFIKLILHLVIKYDQESALVKNVIDGEPVAYFLYRNGKTSEPIRATVQQVESLYENGFGTSNIHGIAETPDGGIDATGENFYVGVSDSKFTDDEWEKTKQEKDKKEGEAYRAAYSRRKRFASSLEKTDFYHYCKSHIFFLPNHVVYEFRRADSVSSMASMTGHRNICLKELDEQLKITNSRFYDIAKAVNGAM